MTNKNNDPGIKDRIRGLLKSVLEDSDIGKMYHPVIIRMVDNFLTNADESNIIELIENFRDEIIPWLLTGDAE